MERAVDGDNVTLRQHVLEVLDPPAANLLLDLGRQRLVVEVEELLAVERLQPAEHALADTANGDGTDDLVLEVVLVLGHGRDVPVAGLDLLVGGDEVADEDEDGHDDVLGDGNDVGARDLGDGDAAIGLVGGVEVDVVRANAGRHGDLEVLRLREALCGEVAGVESAVIVSSLMQPLEILPVDSRRCDDDFGIHELLIELAVLALLVRGRHERVTLVLKPFPDPELVLRCPEQTGFLVGMLLALQRAPSAAKLHQCSE